MNKQELISKVAEKAGLSKKDAEAAVNAMLCVIEETLAKGDFVKLVGFGMFTTKNRKPRTGRNPHEPEKTFEIPAARAPIFKAGKGLKDAVNKDI